MKILKFLKLNSLNLDDKRRVLVYFVLILWIVFGILGAIDKHDFDEMAVYFLSLTGFVGVYVWGESIRPSESSSIFKTGPSSTREILTYMIIMLWSVIGVYGILNDVKLVSLAAYFGALTPFVGAYILGRTYKQSLEEEKEVRDLLKTKYLTGLDHVYDPFDNQEDGSVEGPDIIF